jgi:DNA-binding transcriptional LysR family regulator
MADDISELRLLVQLVAAGSMVDAAERLNSSPPAMSRRLAAMESRLGVRLFVRNARRFALTEEGGLLYERALGILTDIDDAEAEATAKGRDASGRLRIGAPLQIGRLRLAPLLAQFAYEHPKVRIELVLTDADLEGFEEDIDIMLRLSMPSSPNLVVKRLRHGRRVLIASPAYLKVRGIPSHPDDLKNHNCLILIRGRKRFDRWKFEEDGTQRDFLVEGNLATTSSDVIHAWVLAGVGIGLKAVWDIEGDLKDGRLVEVLADYACDQSDLYAVYATRQFLPSRMRVFLDFIAEHLSDQSEPTKPVARSAKRPTKPR